MNTSPESKPKAAPRGRKRLLERVAMGIMALGALMMFLLMGLVLALGVTGWMQGLDAFWGVEWLQELHEVLANALLLSAGLHAASAIVIGRIERTRLVKAMFTGVKEHY